ncbi:MAG: NAD(P)-dependent oxidoreductase [Candidatus Heimdallarchaeota archaeon]|nr:NAD(P)-dependent oxidoreductase [Candidatus Heimdallarchaeota archaeon]
MTILITGVTGFLGSRLVKELRNLYPRREISALVLPSEKDKCEEYSNHDIKFHFGNLTSNNDLKGCLDGVDSVFHLAAVVDDLAPLSDFYEVNHIGTKNLLEEFVKAGSSTFIYMSTMGVYGFDLPTSPFDETLEINLIPGYRESKYFGEKEVFSYANKYGFKASALRPPIIFGPGDHFTPNIFNLVESGSRIPLIRKGNAVIAYSYVGDIVEALIKMEQLEGAKNEIFNHASFHVTLREIFETAAEICNKELKTFNLNYQIAMFVGILGEIQWKIFKKKPLLNKYRVMQLGKTRKANTNKIEETLGISSKKTFKEALTEAFEWYSKQRERTPFNN